MPSPIQPETTKTEAVLDTSGVVTIPSGPYAGDWTWERVGRESGSFTQGYMGALFASMDAPPTRNVERQGVYTLKDGRYHAIGFSDLAPETLARIMEDCRRGVELSSVPFGARYNPNRAGGLFFWQDRQAGVLTPGYPPLTVALDDAGKVVFA